MNVAMSITSRTQSSAPRMQSNPRPERPLEERVMDALQPGLIKTFSQLEMGCGGLDPLALASVEVFSDELDKTLRKLMAEGKVRCVARRPTLCFERGTVLDQIVKGLELDE